MESLELFVELVRSQIDRPMLNLNACLKDILMRGGRLQNNFVLLPSIISLVATACWRRRASGSRSGWLQRFGNRVPEKYLVVHGYTSPFNPFFCST